MSIKNLSRFSIFALAYSLFIMPLTAQPALEPLGDVRVVPDVTDFFQAQMGVDPSGGIALIWSKTVTTNIASQIFDSQGDDTSPVFRIGSHATVPELHLGPLVSAGADAWLYTWESVESRPPLPLDSRLWGRFYDERGRPLTREFEIDRADDGSQITQEGVASNRNGEAVVVWTRSRFQPNDRRTVLKAQRFGRDLRPAGEPIVVRVGANDLRYHVALAGVGIDDSGRFVVVWEETPLSGVSRLFFQRFNRRGEALGNRRLVTHDLPAGYGPSSISRESGGEFAIAWRNEEGRSWFRPFDEFGRPLSASVEIDDFVSQVLHDRHGNLLIVRRQFDEFNIRSDDFLQIFNRLGEPVSEPIHIPRPTSTDDAFFLGVAMDDEDTLIVHWTVRSGNRHAQAFQRFRLTGL